MNVLSDCLKNLYQTSHNILAKIGQTETTNTLNLHKTERYHFYSSYIYRLLFSYRKLGDT